MRAWVIVAMLAGCGRIAFDPLGEPQLLVMGGTGGAEIDDVALGDRGELAVTGSFTGAIEFGGETAISQATGSDVFVLTVAGDGTKQWLMTFGCSIHCDAQGVSWLADGVVAGGYLEGTLANGGGVTSDLGQDALIMWLTSTGTVASAAHYGGTRNVQIRGLDAGGGTVAVGGFYADTADFGTGLLPTTGPVDNGFVAAFGDTDRVAKFHHSYNGAQGVWPNDIAVGADGSVCVTGSTETTTDFGDGTLTVPQAIDAFVVKYDPQGNYVWHRVSTGTGNEAGLNVDVAPNGDCIATGFYATAQTWDGVPLPHDGDAEVFVVRYAAATGAQDWVRTIHGIGIDNVNGIAVDVHDRIALAGNFNAPTMLIDRAITPDGLSDGYLMLLDGRGSVLSVEHLGGTGSFNRGAGGISFDPSGTLVAYGLGFDGELVIHGRGLAATPVNADTDGAVLVFPVP